LGSYYSKKPIKLGKVIRILRDLKRFLPTFLAFKAPFWQFRAPYWGFFEKLTPTFFTGLSLGLPKGG